MERVIQTGVLSTGFYGEKEKNDKEAILIGNKIVAQLKNQGFTVEWDGSASKRIEVVDFKWQNRFTSDDEVAEKWGYDSDYSPKGQEDQRWIEINTKSYSNFALNRDFISKHNNEAREGKHTYFLKMNQFGDKVRKR